MIGKKHVLKISLITGLSVAFFGFGAMNLLWYLTKDFVNSSGLKGLYYYKAATWGDGVFLPTIVGSLMYYLLTKEKLKGRQYRISLLLGMIGLLFGVREQLSWLKDPDIGLNWTLPQVGYFNFAGKYHAVFFAVMIFLLVLLFSTVWFSRWNSEHLCLKSDEIISYTLIWMAGSGFTFMISLDDLTVYMKYEELLLYVYGALLLVAIIFNNSSAKRFDYNSFVCSLTGITVSLGLSFILMSTSLDYVYIAIAISLALLSLVFLCYSYDNIGLFICYSLMIMNSVFWLTLAMFLTQGYIRYVFCFLILIVPTLIAGVQKRNIEYFSNFEYVIKSVSDGIRSELYWEVAIDDNIWLGFIGFLVLEMYLISLMSSVPNNIIELTVNVLITFIVGSAIKGKFDIIKAEEEKYEKSGINDLKKKISTMQVHIFVFIILIFIGASILYAMIIKSTLIGGISLPYQSIKLAQSTIYSLILLFSTLAFQFIITRGSHYYNLRFKVLKKIWNIVVSVIFYSILVYATYTIHPINYEGYKIYHSIIPSMVIGLSLFVGMGFGSNLLSLSGYKLNASTKMIRAVITISNMAVIFIVLSPMRLRYSITVNIMISGIIMFLSLVIIPFILGRGTFIQPQNTERIANSSLSGVLQDGLMVWVLILVGGIIPTAILEKSAILNIENYFIVYTIILWAYWAFEYSLKNNVEHLDDRYALFKLKSRNSDENHQNYRRQFLALQRHLRFQNTLVIFSLILYCVLPLFKKLFFDSHFEDANIKAEIKTKRFRTLSWLIEQYIPKKYELYEQE